MPRGNIETINPKAMVAHSVQRFMEEYNYHFIFRKDFSGCYADAFSIARRHRLDMNFLIDCNIDKFLNNVDSFIRDLDNPDFLIQFISDIR